MLPAPHFLTHLATHAERQSDKTALRCSNGGGGADDFDEITYAQLHARVIGLSATLRPLAAPGERALILMPSGEDFVVAFLACLHAGIIAVPAYPPRRNRNRDRVLGIHDDAQPALILTTAAAEKNVREALPETKARVVVLEGGPHSPLCGQDQGPKNPTGDCADHLVADHLHNPDGIAFLQYTSGSTGAPKGTVITHANLLANLDAIQSLFQDEPEHEFVSWLPPFHDMGLMGCLHPFSEGMTVTLLTADEFLRQPVRWLQVIASRQALVSSGAPNFAYQLLAERVTNADLATLDLSRWRIAFNGAEPVQAATLEKFARSFASCGFGAEAWLPCYGLAETTLLASGRRGEVSHEDTKAQRNDGNASLQPFVSSCLRVSPVSCGPPALDTRITIHHAENGAAMSDGEVGEIHIHSPSVALGYWNNPTATTAAFPQSGTLRTGDLGFLHDGELYVTGRVKDLIIIRGRNLHPHDIENCVAALLPTATGANSIAAFEFSGNGSGSGALGVLIEAPRAWVASVRKQDGEITSHVRNIRQAVAETFEITADLIAFVAPGDFPRTSSGKVQRSASRDGVMNGTLPVIHRDQFGVGGQGSLRGFAASLTGCVGILPASHDGRAGSPPAIDRPEAYPPDALITHLERGLIEFLRREKLGNMDAVPHDATFSSLGIDSLGAASLAIEIEKTFGVKITDETLYDYPTLQRLAGYIESRRAPEGTPAEQGRAIWLATLSTMNERVSSLEREGRYFYEQPFEAQDSTAVWFGGRRCVHLSSYSYLGFVADEGIRELVDDYSRRLGCGSHGTRMLASTCWHLELEALIAKTLESESAVVFGTGFVTNWAVISTLMSAEDTIIADEWIHASLVDGCKGSGATFIFFRHNNLEHLAQLLAVPTQGKTLVVVDAVYSMEGDIAPVPEISALAHAHGAWLMVDEAHSLGVLGARGLGIQEHFSLPPDAIDIKMGTLSKAIPSAGGYIAGSADLIAALRHNVRPFIFSGAPTPPMVAAAMAGFEILLSQPERVRKLHDNIRFFRDGLCRINLTPPDTGTAIIPLMCRDEASTFTFAKRCLADGLYVTPIVFPAVPQNAPRIRTSITAALSKADITLALGVIGRHREWLV